MNDRVDRRSESWRYTETMVPVYEWEAMRESHGGDEEESCAYRKKA